MVRRGTVWIANGKFLGAWFGLLGGKHGQNSTDQLVLDSNITKLPVIEEAQTMPASLQN